MRWHFHPEILAGSAFSGWHRLNRVTVVSYDLTRRVSVWVPGDMDHNYDFDLPLEMHYNSCDPIVLLSTRFLLTS